MPTDSLLEKSRSLLLVRNEPSLLQLKESGTHVIQPPRFTDEYSGVHKGKVICPRLLCDESVSEFAHQSPSSL